VIHKAAVALTPMQEKVTRRMAIKEMNKNTRGSLTAHSQVHASWRSIHLFLLPLSLPFLLLISSLIFLSVLIYISEFKAERDFRLGYLRPDGRTSHDTVRLVLISSISLSGATSGAGPFNVSVNSSGIPGDCSRPESIGVAATLLNSLAASFSDWGGENE
jgi:hypothetical protein